MVQWAKQTKALVKANKPIGSSKSAQFLLCNYHWVLNTHNKALMLQTYNRVDWYLHQEQLNMRAMFLPNRSAIEYFLEIRRGHILEDSLKKLV